MPAAPERTLALRLAEAARIRGGTPHGRLAPPRLLLAAAVSLGGSLLADAALVAIGEALFPSTKGFGHFRFADYGLLTAAGVVVACAAWSVVVRLSWAPRWLFARLAVVVTGASWLADLWILLRHEPARGVLVLALMHLGVALVTYHAIIRLAPALPLSSPALDACGAAPRRPAAAFAAPTAPAARSRPFDAGGRAVWAVMACLVGIELLLGAVALVAVPFGRPDELVPRHGEVVYLLHAAVGLALAAGSLWLVLAVRTAPRVQRVSAALGLAGLVVGATGGGLAALHPLRLLGAGLMLLGGGLAGCAYLVPAVEAPSSSEDGEALAGSRIRPVQRTERPI